MPSLSVVERAAAKNQAAIKTFYLKYLPAYDILISLWRMVSVVVFAALEIKSALWKCVAEKTCIHAVFRDLLFNIFLSSLLKFSHLSELL